jgi:hypothetical protein
VLRDPCRDEYTICIAVAPDPVFTTHTSADTAAGLARRLSYGTIYRKKLLRLGVDTECLADQEPSMRHRTVTPGTC